MKLIQEINEDVKCGILTEGEGSSQTKKYYIESIFMQGNIVNRNRRNYPMRILESATNKYITEKVKTKRAMGELGHPDGPAINLDRVSHVIESLKKEGNDYFGRAKIMDTPFGKIVKNLIDEDIKFGVSSRALGSVRKNAKGIDEVQNDLYIATAGDIVADPSAPHAFVNGIMEGAEWTWNNGILVESEVSAIRRDVDKAFGSKDIKKREAVMIEAFEKLFKK